MQTRTCTKSKKKAKQQSWRMSFENNCARGNGIILNHSVYSENYGFYLHILFILLNCENCV